MANSDELITLRFNAIPGNAAGMTEVLNTIKNALEQITRAAKVADSSELWKKQSQLTLEYIALLKNLENQISKNQIISNANIQGTKSLAVATNEVGAAAAQMTKNQFGRAFNMQTKYGREGAKLLSESMDRVGYAVMAQPKTWGQYISNLRTANSAMKDTSLAGIATEKSIKAAAGGAPTMIQGLSGIQRVSSMIRLAKSNLDGFTQAWEASTKEQQWAGRQMIQGISLPLALFATKSLAAWKSVETEILSIKKVTDFKGMGDGDVKYTALRKEINSVAMEYGATTKAVAHTYQEIVQLGVRGSDNVHAYAKSVQELSMLGNMDTDTAFQFFRTTKALFADKPGTSMIDAIEKTNGLMAQLNAIADNTSVKMQDLAQGIPEVAPVMSQMGFSAAATAASLAGMYNRGIPATEAAHALKFALQRLVNPTQQSKKVIDELGFSFFDANGKASDTVAKMFALSDQFRGMNDAERAAAAPELFGTRQAARMNSYFNDLAAGKQELIGLTNGTLRLDQVTSDFLKGLVYSKEITIKGVNVDDPVTRYKHAVEEFKKDPTTAISRLKTAFNQLFIQVGANIAPTLLSVGEKITNFLKTLQDAPPIVYKVALAVGAFAAAMGPIKYSIAMAQYAMMSFLKVSTMMIPGITNITNAEALMNKQLLANQKILQIGSRTYMLGFKNPVNTVRAKLGMFDKIDAMSKEQLAQATLEADAANNLFFQSQLKLTQSSEYQIALTSGVITSDMSLVQMREALTIATEELTVAQRMSIDLLLAEGIAAEADAAATFQLAAAQAAAAQTASANAAANEGSMLSKAAPVVIAKKIGAGVKAAGVFVADGFKTMKTGATNVVAKISTMFQGGFISGIRTAFTSLFSTITGFLTTGLVAFSWIVLIIGAIVAAVVILVVLFKGIKSHWNQVMAAMKPGIDAIKNGFQRIKDAFSGIIDKFKSIIGQLGSGSSEGERASSVWEGIGTAAGKVADIIGTALGWLGNLIGWLMPIFEAIFYTVKDLVGFVFALFTGDWQKAIHYAIAVFYEDFLRPIILGAQTIARVFAALIDKILGGASGLLKFLGMDSLGKSLDNWGNSMKDFANNPSWVSDLDKNLRSGIGGVFGNAVHAGANQAKPAAQDAGKSIGADVGDAINQGVANTASGTSWVETWISKVYGNLDKELEKIKKSAMASLEKANEVAMKVYDARIKAIDDQEKAEEKLFKTQEYLAKKRELLAKSELDNNNYKKARFTAIYEGRYDDARKLDLEHAKTVEDNTKSINDLDTQRNQDLLKEERTAKKDEINIQKQAAQDAWEIRKKSLEDQIDLIVQYAPATVEEFQNMMDAINQVVVDNGGQWPDHAKTAMDRMLEVFQQSNGQIADEFLKAGKDARSAWMIGFASANTVAIIAKQNGDVGGNNGGGTDTTKTALEAMTPEQKSAFDSFITKSNMPPPPEATPEQLAAWVGSGAGIGSVGASGNTAGMNSITVQPKSVTANEIDNIITKFGGSAEDYNKEHSFKSRQIQYDPIHNFGEVYNILTLLDKGVSEKQIKDKTLYLGFTDETISAALDIYKRGAKEATVTSQSVEDTWGKTTAKISTAFGLSEKEIDKYGSGIDKKFTVYTDKMGSQWKVVNGILQDQYGTAAEFIKNKSGEVTGIQIIGTNEVRDVTISNIGKAEEIFKQLTTEGIKPGTVEAESLIQKIKDLGLQVLQVNGKTVLINIDLNDPNHVVKTLNSIDTTGANFGETVWINGKPMVYTAAGLGESPDYVKNDSGIWVKKATGGMYSSNTGAFKMAMGGMVQYAGGGSLVKNRKNGILANIGEGGYDEYVITTDPKYRAANVGYLTAAAAQLGIRSQASNAMRAVLGSEMMFSGARGSSGSAGSGVAGGGSGDVYICVDTFVGEEAWFNELMKKYDMKVTPQERKKIGQQRRTISSYNDRYSVK